MTDTTDNPMRLSRIGRVLLGLGLVGQAAEDFRDMESAIEYADSEGVPVPRLTAPLGSGMVLTAGIGIALWRVPRLATGAAATFLLAVTPMMHDFWTAEDGEQKGDRLAFFGNLAMLGGVLVFFERAYRDSAAGMSRDSG